MKLKKLSLNRETIRDLTNQEAQNIAGGYSFWPIPGAKKPKTDVDNSTARPVCCVVFGGPGGPKPYF